MSLILEVFVRGNGVENFALSLNYCQLNALSIFAILCHLLKAFMTHKKNRPFSVAELIASNILSFQILYLNSCNLRQKYKTQSLLQF